MKVEPILPTVEEAARIKAGDRELINRYYMANYEFIQVVTRGYCRNSLIEDKSLWEDMVQECYLYFGNFSFDHANALVRSIRDVCVYVRWGGERVYHQVRQGNTEILTILDEPIQRETRHGAEPMTLADTIESSFDVLEELEPEESKTDAVFFTLAELMTPREREAFEWFYYSDMTAREVGAQMGLTLNGAQSLKNAYLRRLRKCEEEVMQRLSAVLMLSGALAVENNKRRLQA